MFIGEWKSNSKSRDAIIEKDVEKKVFDSRSNLLLYFHMAMSLDLELVFDSLS